MPWCCSKVSTTCVGFALAQQAVIHKDAGQPIADGAVDQRGRHRAVHAAAQPADDVTVRPHLRVDALRPSPR